MAITLKKFNPNAEQVKPFDCRVDLLNDFLLEEDTNIPNARHHALELLAETYVFEDDVMGKTVAYFSLLNDKVERDLSDKTVWNRLSREIPNAKRRQSYPAVKIGRLAVLIYRNGSVGHKKPGTGWCRYFTSPSSLRRSLSGTSPATRRTRSQSQAKDS